MPVVAHDADGNPIELPRLIRVEKHGSGRPGRVWIDGKLVEYATEDGVRVHTSRDRMPGITITLVAERVEITDCAWIGDDPDAERPA